MGTAMIHHQLTLYAALCGACFGGCCSWCCWCVEGSELFLVTDVVRMIFCNSVFSLLKSVIITPAEILQSLRFPWLCCFPQVRGELPAASLQRVAMYTMLRSYTYTKTCM